MRRGWSRVGYSEVLTYRVLISSFDRIQGVCKTKKSLRNLLVLYIRPKGFRGKIRDVVVHFVLYALI